MWVWTGRILGISVAGGLVAATAAIQSPSQSNPEPSMLPKFYLNLDAQWAADLDFTDFSFLFFTALYIKLIIVIFIFFLLLLLILI